MGSFVLVHGAWHGAWCWYRVVPELERAGHKVSAIDLPGMGDDPTPAGGVTLDDYAARIAQAVDAAGAPVILVGHSMGGMSITAAAELRPEKLRWLVYLAAFLPKDGESLLMMEERNPDPRVPPHIQPDKQNFIARIDLNQVAGLFYHDCPPEDVALAKSRIRPQSFLPLTAPVRATAARFGKVRRAYFECTQDRAIVPAFQRAMYESSPCERIVKIDAGHSPFFSKPKELARELSALA